MLDELYSDSYYSGYRLNDTIQDWQLSEMDKLILDTGIWLVENRASLSVVANNFGVSRNVVYYRVSLRLPSISHELSCCVKNQLRRNKNR